MRRALTRVFAVCVAAAGLILVVPYAEAVAPDPSAASTTYYNLTGQTPDGDDTPNANISTTIQGTASAQYAVKFDAGSNAVTVGTGVIDPFVRIQNDGGEPDGCGDPCIESGYNTNGTSEFETKDSAVHNWTHAISLSDVGTEVIDGVTYRTFILDINENNNDIDRYLSLDKFQLYLSASDVLTDFCETAPDGAGPDSCFNDGFAGNNPLVWSMDTATADATVGLNYNLNSGSGSGIDLYVRVPDQLFLDAIEAGNGNFPTNPFVYLYSSFGATGVLAKDATGPNCGDGWVDNGPPPNNCPAGYLPGGNYGQNSGFEEWSTLKGVPEPMSVALLLVGLAAIGFMRRQQPSPIAC